MPSRDRKRDGWSFQRPLPSLLSERWGSTQTPSVLRANDQPHVRVRGSSITEPLTTHIQDDESLKVARKRIHRRSLVLTAFDSMSSLAASIGSSKDSSRELSRSSSTANREYRRHSLISIGSSRFSKSSDTKSTSGTIASSAHPHPVADACEPMSSDSSSLLVAVSSNLDTTARCEPPVLTANIPELLHDSLPTPMMSKFPASEIATSYPGAEGKVPSPAQGKITDASTAGRAGVPQFLSLDLEPSGLMIREDFMPEFLTSHNAEFSPGGFLSGSRLIKDGPDHEDSVSTLCSPSRHGSSTSTSTMDTFDGIEVPRTPKIEKSHGIYIYIDSHMGPTAGMSKVEAYNPFNDFGSKNYCNPTAFSP